MDLRRMAPSYKGDEKQTGLEALADVQQLRLEAGTE